MIKTTAFALGTLLAAAPAAQAGHRYAGYGRVIVTNQGWAETVYAPSPAPALPRDTNNFCGTGWHATAEGCRLIEEK